MTDLSRIVSENRRAVWLIVAGLVANLALLALVVYPLSQKEKGSEAEAQAASNELAIARADFANAKATVSGQGEADAELKKFYGEVLPPGFSGARSILFPHLDQLARSSNLRPANSSIRPAPPGERSDLQKLTLTMSLSGEYTNIRRFVHELETAPEFLVLESVALSRTEADSQDLRVDAQVATYFRAGDGD
jgi:Tfp pilus assembly protein PilO